MNIGYGDLLRHLPTKFLCRRSDIIVSSTLSLTITPKDDVTVSNLNFAEIDDNQLGSWMRYWHKLRAQDVEIAYVNRAHYRDSAKTRFSSVMNSFSRMTSYLSSDISEILRARTLSPTGITVDPSVKLK